MIPVSHDGPLQMSAAQLRQWFQFRIDGPNPVNNIPFAARPGLVPVVDKLWSSRRGPQRRESRQCSLMLQYLSQMVPSVT